MSADQPPGAWTIVEWLSGAIVGLLQFIFGYQILRISKLEEKKADKEDLHNLIQEIREERASSDEAREAVRAELHELSTAVGRLEGRLFNR
jgi:hypothetical protein